MLKNYLTIAWRTLLKHKGFSLINIIGLGIGLAAFGLIALYVSDELSYDKHNKKADRIFRVVQHGTWSGGEFNLAVTSAPYGSALKNDYGEVEDAVRINTEGGGKIVYGDKQLSISDVFFTDNSIFNVFSYHFLYGNAATALSTPQSIVLTKGLAMKLFGDASQALGKTILFDGNFPNKVSGVIDDVPRNSHFSFSALRSFDTNYTEGWGNSNLYTYLLLNDPSDNKTIEARSRDFYNKYLKTTLFDVRYNMELQPLTSIHLHSRLDYEIGSNGNITYVYVFSIVAMLILVIAVINYVNLATARSSARIKEIGVRKVIGSNRRSLMLMFFVESILLTILAAFAALMIIHFFMPYFNEVSGKSLSLSQIGVSKIGLVTMTFALLTGILAGIYPSLFLSGFETIPAMKGQLGNQSATATFRKSLVTFQFVVTIVMISGALIIFQQLHYVLKKDLGFNKTQTLTFHIQKESVRRQVEAIKQELLKSPHVESVAVAGNPIGNNNLGGSGFSPDPAEDSVANRKMVQNLMVDEGFIPTMQIKMVRGRNFSQDMSTDRDEAIIINETLVNELGWKEPIGRKVKTNGQVRTVVGVTRDFNTYSLQHKIAPVVLSMPEKANDQDNLYIRIGNDYTQATLDYISKVYSQFDPENKAEFRFLDQNFSQQYQTEEKQGKLLVIFTVLAITIASLGLLGMVAFSAQQRTKEIGVRKVLGATVSSIILLLSKDFLKLVLLAIVLATPIAVWTMHNWLQNFAYRIGIQWWVFALAGILAVLIAILTVGFQAVNAAVAKPVKSLRVE